MLKPKLLNYLLLLPLYFSVGLPALAQDVSAEAPPAGAAVLVRMIPMFIMVFAIYYLMVLRPQEKKFRSQKALIDNLKKGDGVVTDSGLLGRVAGIEKDHILLEVSQNVRIKVEPSHISKRQESKKAA